MEQLGSEFDNKAELFPRSGLLTTSGEQNKTNRRSKGEMKSDALSKSIDGYGSNDNY